MRFLDCVYVNNFHNFKIWENFLSDSDLFLEDIFDSID